jgi:hypothetical protein
VGQFRDPRRHQRPLACIQVAAERIRIESASASLVEP